MATHLDLTFLSEYRAKKSLQTDEFFLPMMSGTADELERWPILAELSPDFAKTVRLCCVFGFKGTEALFATFDDEVWALGCNFGGRLGTGNAEPCSGLHKVTALAGKAVHSFAYGDKHVLALTGAGKVYGWGVREYFQVSKAKPAEIYKPTLVNLGDETAVEIACGAAHSVCRTEKGNVYSWGRNFFGQIGNGRTANQKTPYRVKGLIAELECKGISCSRHSTVAIFANGDVYAWGSNGFGQLGIGSVNSQTVPVRVNLKNIVIKEVSCGSCHTLALAEDGSLYVWGRNNEGQLGVNNRHDQSSIIRHSVLFNFRGKITEIAAFENSSAVKTKESEVFMWGASRLGSVVNPTLVSCKSVRDVSAAWAMTFETPMPLVVKSFSIRSLVADSGVQETSHLTEWAVNLLSTIAESFDDPSFSDVKFLVGGETIHAHKSLLSFQSEYFRKMFQGPWNEDEGNVIEVKQSRYPVYKALLQYFYCGQMNIRDTDALELLELVSSFPDDALKMKCQAHMKTIIRIENCVSFYSTALRCDARDLESFSLRFAVEHFAAVAQTKAFTALPAEISEKFFEELAKH